MRFPVGVALSLLVCSVLGDDCPQDLCDSTQTCCEGPTPGEFGCCPDPNAVCCSDGLHCCPEDTVCNLSAGTCDSLADTIVSYIFRKKIIPPPVQKVKAAGLELANKVETVYCPGGAYFCADGTTCCLLSTGAYGCCPYPSAVCCADRVHCCPSGTHCDATYQFCVQGTNTYAALFKKPAFAMA